MYTHRETLLIMQMYMFFAQMDVKANADVKHSKDSLAAEKKKKRTLEKSLVDVSVMFNRLRRQNLTVNITGLILNTTAIWGRRRCSYAHVEKVNQN